jgi:hypothetical protein
MTEFTKRPKGQGIFRIQTYAPGKLFTDFPIEQYATAILHYQDRSVVIKNISRKPDGALEGTVLGFEPPAMELGELKADDAVTFSEDVVFSASKKD